MMMARQIVAVVVGMLLSVLLAVAGGFLLYRLSRIWPEHTLGAIARYLGDPFTALVVGTAVGLLAKNRAALLALLSLTPMAVGTFAFGHRLSFPHILLMSILMLVNLAVGMVVATFVARNRAISKTSLQN
jgi:hypothetical protein